MVLGELARASGVESLRVPRLSPRAVAELAEPTKVNPVELYRRTGGNAFFVTEVLAAGTHEIPSTVRDAVLARAAGLSRRSGSLLEAVAIAQPADLSVIGLIAADAVEDLDECIDCGMLVPNATGVAFRHELARQVIEEAIPPTRKKALHALALDALAGSSDYAWLAHHAEGQAARQR